MVFVLLTPSIYVTNRLFQLVRGFILPKQVSRSMWCVFYIIKKSGGETLSDLKLESVVGA